MYVNGVKRKYNHKIFKYFLSTFISSNFKLIVFYFQMKTIKKKSRDGYR